MAAPIYTLGKGDGSHLETSNFNQEKLLELVGTGIYNTEVLPLPPYGLSQSAALPAQLIDGLFLAPTDAPFDPAAAATQPVVNYGSGTRFGTSFYDWAVDGNRPLYMVFSANRLNVAGMDNPYPFKLTGGFAAEEKTNPPYPAPEVGQPIVNPSFDPGQFGSSSVTGLTGVFPVWISDLHIGDADFSTWAVNDKLEVLNGKLKKITAGTPRVVAIVQRLVTVDTITKAMVIVDTTNTQHN